MTVAYTSTANSQSHIYQTINCLTRKRRTKDFYSLLLLFVRSEVRTNYSKRVRLPNRHSTHY